MFMGSDYSYAFLLAPFCFLSVSLGSFLASLLETFGAKFGLSAVVRR
jgi:hypothetical protein